MKRDRVDVKRKRQDLTQRRTAKKHRGIWQREVDVGSSAAPDTGG